MVMSLKNQSEGHLYQIGGYVNKFKYCMMEILREGVCK